VSLRTPTNTMRRPRCSEALLDLLDLEGLDDVLLLHLAVAVEADTAREALGDLLDVLLEALQRSDLPLPDGGAITEEPGEPAAEDLAGRDHATGDDDAADLEDRANLGLAARLLELGGREEAFH